MENFQEDLTTLGTGVAKMFMPALEREEIEIKEVKKEGASPSIEAKGQEQAQQFEAEAQAYAAQAEAFEAEIESAMENIKLVPYHEGAKGQGMDFSSNYNDLVISPDLDDTIEGKRPIETPTEPDRFSSPEEFIDYLLPLAKKVSKQTGIPADFIVAQAAHETGWGDSLGKDSKNLFGIKANNGWKGNVSEFGTHEFVDGKRVDMTEPFRKYGTYEESMADYASFLQSNPRYKGALSSASDPIKFAQELQKAGYATDPKYSSKLVSVLESVRNRM